MIIITYTDGQINMKGTSKELFDPSDLQDFRNLFYMSSLANKPNILIATSIYGNQNIKRFGEQSYGLEYFFPLAGFDVITKDNGEMKFEKEGYEQTGSTEFDLCSYVDFYDIYNIKRIGKAQRSGNLIHNAFKDRTDSEDNCVLEIKVIKEILQSGFTF